MYTYIYSIYTQYIHVCVWLHTWDLAPQKTECVKGCQVGPAGFDPGQFSKKCDFYTTYLDLRFLLDKFESLPHYIIFRG